MNLSKHYQKSKILFYRAADVRKLLSSNKLGESHFDFTSIPFVSTSKFAGKAPTPLVSFADVLIIPGWSDSRLPEVPPDLSLSLRLFRKVRLPLRKSNQFKMKTFSVKLDVRRLLPAVMQYY